MISATEARRKSDEANSAESSEQFKDIMSHIEKLQVKEYTRYFGMQVFPL
jgi:hypothetical protein